MINKTKDYSIFKLREDNRERLDETHIKRLMDSIQSRNLLELRPISVNSKMEVIDGQHRLEAVKRLNLEIYYSVNKDLKSEDIILMNVAKVWTLGDYLNYYSKNQYPEYIKLREFMKKRQISITIALNILIYRRPALLNDFKKGDFKFDEKLTDMQFEICLETIGHIKKMCNYHIYTKTARFWAALMEVVRHKEFDAKRWKSNTERLIDRFGPRSRFKDYLKCFIDIYNWKNPNKILVYTEVEQG